VLWGYPFSLVRQLLLVFLVLLGACFAGAYILSQPGEPVAILVHLLPVAASILLAMYVTEVVGVTERPLPPVSLEAIFWSIATSCIVMSFGYAVWPTYPPSKTLVCAAPVISAFAVYLQRKWVEIRGSGGAGYSAALLAPDRAHASRAMADLADAPGVVVKGVILSEAGQDRSPMAGLPVHDVTSGQRWLESKSVRIVAVSHQRAEGAEGLLSGAAGRGCFVDSVSGIIAKVRGRVDLEAPQPTGVLAPVSERRGQFPLQRALDLGAALLVLAPSALLAIVVALVVKLSSRGPVLYRQRRVGLGGAAFEILKFRTMQQDAERDTGPVWAQEDDPRITRVGRFLRKTRMDEIPQLWNILKGEMSLVGPRPERPAFVAELRAKIPLYDARHCVRPGLTGWAQIRYPYGADENDAREKLAYDLFYILNRSTTFYVAVVLETIKVLVFQRGAR